MSGSNAVLPLDGNELPCAQSGERLPLVPETRISVKNAASVRGDGEYVLYWMIATRRARWNFRHGSGRRVGRRTRQADPRARGAALATTAGRATGSTASSSTGCATTPPPSTRRGSATTRTSSRQRGPARASGGARRARGCRGRPTSSPASSYREWSRRRPRASTSSWRRWTRTACCPWRPPIGRFIAPSTSAASSQRELPEHLDDFPRRVCCRGRAGVLRRLSQGRRRALAACLAGASRRPGRVGDLPIDHAWLRWPKRGATRPRSERCAGFSTIGSIATARAQRPGCQRRERAFGLPALRPHLLASDPRRHRSPRRLVALAALGPDVGGGAAGGTWTSRWSRFSTSS